MKARVLHIGATLVALYCTVWIALAPVIPQIHQVFADHNHFFSAQHQRIEDAGPRSTLSAFAVFSVGISDRATPPDEQETGAELGPPCDFSNLVVVGVGAAQDTRLVDISVLPTLQESPPATGVDIPTSDIFLLAPKHSPPSIA